MGTNRKGDINLIKCIYCGSKMSYNSDVQIYNDEYMVRKNCRHCGKNWRHELPLLSDINKHVRISIYGKQNSLHRIVYEQVYDVILPKEVDIHHINYHRGDNRPVNLIALFKNCHSHIHNYNGEHKIDVDDINTIKTNHYMGGFSYVKRLQSAIEVV